MRIIELRADNFKRLKAVSVTPSGAVVEISGENGSGKTSTLDAIWAALGGKDAVPDKPIRTGAETASIMVSLGDTEGVKLKVTRKFRLVEGVAKTDLVVESGEGARFSSPQSMLDALVGALCFDPLAFTRLKDEEQIKALRGFVPDVDFARLEGLNKADYDERTDINRRVKQLRAEAAAMGDLQGDLPERVDVTALEAKLGDAATHNADVERRRGAREQAENRIAAIQEEIARLTGEMHGLQQKLLAAPALPEPIDVTDVQEKLHEGRHTNALLDRVDGRRKLEVQIAALDTESVQLTDRIEKRTAEAQKAVQAAKMPIPGLGFGDGVVTLNGEPFAQASQAEKIRASVAIAAAMNPRLRVARISDGSLLDRKSWTAVEEYARANDVQIWIETVQQHGKTAVLIEDGGNSVAVVEPVGDVI